MARVTQRDLIESIVGLRGIAQDLKGALQGAEGEVVMGVDGLSKAAQYLEQVAEELMGLVPDEDVPLPPSK